MPCVLFRARAVCGGAPSQLRLRGACGMVLVRVVAAQRGRRDMVGEWLYVYYRYAKDYLDKVLDWYRQGSD